MEIDKPTIADHTNANHDHSDAANGGTLGSYLQNINSENITDLADVNTSKSKTPADGDVLTYDGVDWNAETPAAGGGGQTIYDYVVDSAGGGDYTTLGACIAVAGVGSTILVKGTTTETGAITISTADITIVGLGIGDGVSQINMDSYNFSWTGANGRLQGAYIQTNTGTISISSVGAQILDSKIRFYGYTASIPVSISGNYSVIKGTLFDDGRNSSSGNGRIGIYGTNTKVIGCHFVVFVGLNYYSIFLNGNYIEFSGNTVIPNSSSSYSSNNKILYPNGTSISVTGNVITDSGTAGHGIYVAGQSIQVTGNTIYGTRGGITINQNWAVITGNSIRVSSTDSHGITTTNNGARSVISGNAIVQISGAGAGIGINLGNSTAMAINGNMIYLFGTGVNLPAGSSYCAVVGNTTHGCTTSTADAGTGNVLANNVSS